MPPRGRETVTAKSYGGTGAKVLRMRIRKVHASSPIAPEYTLCGIAVDVAAVDAEQETPAIAKPSEWVGCAECRKVIDHCRRFTSYQTPAR